IAAWAMTRPSLANTAEPSAPTATGTTIMGGLFKPKMPTPQKAVPLPQEDSEAVRRAKLAEQARLSKTAGRGAVTLAQKDLANFGTEYRRQGLASSPVMTG